MHHSALNTPRTHSSLDISLKTVTGTGVYYAINTINSDNALLVVLHSRGLIKRPRTPCPLRVAAAASDRSAPLL